MPENGYAWVFAGQRGLWRTQADRGEIARRSARRKGLGYYARRTGLVRIGSLGQSSVTTFC